MGDRDVGSEEQAQGEPEGKEEPTLAYCNYELTTEVSRFARHKVAITDVDDIVGTTDAVLYPGDGARAALDEFRSGIEQCVPGEVVPEDGRFPDDAPPTSWENVPLTDEETAGLTDDRVAMTVMSTQEGEPTTTEVMIVQRRADALIVTTSPDKERALELAANAAQRLAESDSVYIGE